MCDTKSDKHQKVSITVHNSYNIVQLLIDTKIVYIYISVNKVGDRNQGRREGSLFISYYTEVYGRALLSLNCTTSLLILTL